MARGNDRYHRERNRGNPGGANRRHDQQERQVGLEVSIHSLSLKLKEAKERGYSFAAIWQYGCDVNRVVLKGDEVKNVKLIWLKEILSLKAAKPYILNRFPDIASSFREQGYDVYELSMTTAERLIVGLGEAHYLETGIKLSKTYGVPYISGSTLKGMLRAFYDDNDDIAKKIFGEGGDSGRKGSVVFLDAYPEVDEPSSLFEVDVMNPHYSGYYTGGEAPSDWMSPVPIFFLVLKPGVKFRGLLIIDGLSEKEIDDLEKKLKEALESRGVGGKKALGYGLFKGINMTSLC